jgi:UDP-N-acetylglucosamine 2-epimerase (non-hydrolysing)
MLDKVLELFEIIPDYDLNVFRPGQYFFELTSNVLMGMKEVLSTEKPDVILVHGDTATPMKTSLDAFY